MKKLEENKAWFNELYWDCLDYGAFEKNTFESTERARYEMFFETLKWIYGDEFDRAEALWRRDAGIGYYEMKEA